MNITLERLRKQNTHFTRMRSTNPHVHMLITPSVLFLYEYNMWYIISMIISDFHVLITVRKFIHTADNFHIATSRQCVNFKYLFHWCWWLYDIISRSQIKNWKKQQVNKYLYGERSWGNATRAFFPIVRRQKQACGACCSLLEYSI